jgi:hypothetical protein
MEVWPLPLVLPHVYLAHVVMNLIQTALGATSVLPDFIPLKEVVVYNVN